ncbi:hypothetical protein Agabi119p4_1121 [Agaricus bisporus var. burnettii]|uniref:Ankyrin repeat protein n=1 Tax=Agaricus bisporus var. burnettii TaxID=192524 RepID=A0A8H7FC34_AGABI|nr:hypothetical protein Agabi119p4_1121 [Agaricus bisporus var. burnettii]
MSNGATPEERLLAAARNDDEDNLQLAIEDGADINCRDGAGDTPLHLAVKHDMTGKTPLHYAIESESEYRTSIIDSLLEAGADTRVKDKHGTTAAELVRPDDTEVLTLIRKANAQNTISRSDIADDDDDDEDGEGSGSDSG